MLHHIANYLLPLSGSTLQKGFFLPSPPFPRDVYLVGSITRTASSLIFPGHLEKAEPRVGRGWGRGGLLCACGVEAALVWGWEWGLTSPGLPHAWGSPLCWCNGVRSSFPAEVAQLGWGVRPGGDGGPPPAPPRGRCLLPLRWDVTNEPPSPP